MTELIDGKIYIITNKINGKIYVGQTYKNLNIRFNQHCNISSKCSSLSNSIQKYGKDNFYIDQIDNAKTIDELNWKEQYWIEKLNTLNPNGYNLSSGGLNYIYTENVCNNRSNIIINKNKNKTGYHNVFYIKSTKQYITRIRILGKVHYIFKSKNAKNCAIKYNEYIIKNNLNRRLNVI